MRDEKWKKVELSQIAKIFDCPHSTPNWTDSGVFVIRSWNVRGGRLNFDKSSFTDEKTYLERVRRAKIEFGDLVLTREAPMGEVCMIPENLKCCLGQRVVLIKPIREKVDPYFLLYSFQSLFVQNQIMASEGTGSTVSNLRIPLIETLKIPLPNLPTQRRIAAILTALDDKIELNRRMNETLEGIAQALWGEWFGKYASGGEELPDGWRWGVISDLVIHSKESITPSKSPDKEYNHFSLPAFDSNQSPERTIGEHILSNKFKVKRYSILVSKLNPRIPRIWSIGNIDEDSAICSTEFQVLVPKKNFYYSFVNLLFQRQEIQEALTARASGTSGSHQRVNPSDILNTETLIPTDNEIQRFDHIVRNLFERKFINNQESHTLTALRDVLLPQLMRGEILS